MKTLVILITTNDLPRKSKTKIVKLSNGEQVRACFDNNKSNIFLEGKLTLKQVVNKLFPNWKGSCTSPSLPEMHIKYQS